MNAKANNLFCKHLIINVLFFLIVTVTFSQTCDGSLEVQKGRSFKTVGEQGAIFTLEISNMGTTAVAYDIKTVLLNSPCGNGRRAIGKSNAQVTSSVNLRTNSLIVQPNQTKSFQVTVESVQQNASAQWGCVNVIATSQNCNTKLETILSAYIPEAPSKEQ